MSVSGLVVTLSPRPARADAAVAALARDRRLDLGPRRERRLALVGDTPSAAEDRALVDWIRRVPGVEHVDVVSVHFGDDEIGSQGARP